MKKIDFEAHFLTDEYIDCLTKNNGYPRYTIDEETGDRRLHYTADASIKVGDAIIDKLLDLGEGRLSEMDAVGVDVQVLSLTAPGLEQLESATGTALSKLVNNALFNATRKNPDRLLGFAALAPQSPEDAADELERAVNELGFKGWNTHSNIGGEYLDEEKYRPILERAEKLDVPIYIHPTVPAIRQLRVFGYALSGASFGFGIETAMCMMRLILSGVFDEHPRLKIMIGHYGEILPFLLARVDWSYERPPGFTDRPRLERKPSEYLKDNMLVTTSGKFFEPAFMCTYEALGTDSILLGTDYPYEDLYESVEFLEDLPLSAKDKEKIYHANAKRVGIA